MVTRQIHTDPEHWLLHVEAERGNQAVPLLRTAIHLIPSSFIEEGLGLANILLEIGLDNEGLAAAVIYPALKTSEIHLDTVSDHLGENNARLLRDSIQMGALGKLQHLEERKSHQLENLRKMLLAMVADVRAVLIILAERLWLLRQAKTLSKNEQEKFAEETMDVFAPLANRLGVGHLKWEMEDLCFRYLKPDIYKKIAKWLDSKRDEREIYIQKVMQILRENLAKKNITSFDITGRVKHIYSIYRKMQRKSSEINEIYDISAVRVLVSDIEDCYAVLSIVHEMWRPIPSEFDDYITHPKPNGYRSIHTAIEGPEERIVEVQIRTFQMHQESELGVAAHWKYKEGGGQTSDYEAKIAWLRQVMEWQKEVSKETPGKENKAPPKDLFADRVYVFTPTGEIIDLPQGATPLDFAYHIHSEVGHRCKGAKISGNIVPLTYHLQTGEKVEILTAKQPNPSRDWLNPHSGYLTTQRAKSKVLHWFKAQESEEPEEKPKEKKEADIIKELELPILKKSRVSNKAAQDIQILGVGHLLTQIAKCCKPLPGENIIGYITQGKGVSIHRNTCKNIITISENSKNRLIEVDWGEKISDLYPVDLKIEAYDRQGLLRDVTTYFSSEKINVLGIQTFTDKNSHEAHLNLTIEISNLERLQFILSQLKKIPNIIRIWRETR
jgi:GTP pyrophosphokinase